MKAAPPALARPLRVIAETADADLLARPLRSLADIEAIERTPLERRLGVADFSRRVELALATRDPDATAIFYVPDGDVERDAGEKDDADHPKNIHVN